MHSQLTRSWTVAQLAKMAALSRSAFFERFTRSVGLPPMEYLLGWPFRQVVPELVELMGIEPMTS